MMESTTESDLLSPQLGDTIAIPTIPALAPVSCLIEEHATREGFLGELPSEHRLTATEILHSVTQLKETTGWDSDTLIHYLGCPTTKVGAFRGLSTEEFEECNRYVGLLRTLTGTVETAADKRMLLLGCGHVYVKANRDMNAVSEAFTKLNFENNALSPMEYLELGEIQTALKTALITIDPGYAYTGPSPFDGLPAVHISTGRLDVLAREDERELRSLGERKVVPFMRSHIKKCDGCRAALEDRERRLAQGADSPSAI